MYLSSSRWSSWYSHICCESSCAESSLTPCDSHIPGTCDVTRLSHYHRQEQEQSRSCQSLTAHTQTHRHAGTEARVSRGDQTRLHSRCRPLPLDHLDTSTSRRRSPSSRPLLTICIAIFLVNIAIDIKPNHLSRHIHSLSIPSTQYPAVRQSSLWVRLSSPVQSRCFCCVCVTLQPRQDATPSSLSRLVYAMPSPAQRLP